MADLKQAVPLRIHIFSYNRAPFFENCAESVLRHLTGAVLTIVDDDSESRCGRSRRGEPPRADRRGERVL